MKFFLFWFGMGLAGVAQSLLFAAIGEASRGRGTAIAYFLFAFPIAASAYFILFAWAQRHGRLI